MATGADDPALPPGDRRASRAREGAGLLLLAVLALAVRLAPWAVVFRADGVRLLPDPDPLYHVLQAERLLARTSPAPWFDPGLDYPYGARPLWPPLFDAAIAGATWLWAGRAAARDQIAATGALIAPALGVFTVLVVARLGGMIGGRRVSWPAGLFMAVLPVHVEFTHLGRADQHAAEILIYSAAVLALASSLGPCSRLLAGPAALATLLVAAFWNWHGSAFLVAALWAGVVAAYVTGPEERGRRRPLLAFAVGTAGAAMALALSLAAWAPVGALTEPRLGSVTGFHVVVLVAAAASAAIVLGLDRWRAPRSWGVRLGVASLASAAALAAAGAWPAVRRAIGHGWMLLAADNSWYQGITELDPLLFGGYSPLGREAMTALARLGPLLAAPPAAFLLARARGVDGGRGPLFVLAGVPLLIPYLLMFQRNRFAGYAAPVLALAGAGILICTSPAATRVRWRRAAAGAIWAAVLGHAAAQLWLSRPGLPLTDDDIRVLRWIGARPRDPEQPAVMAGWTDGHAIQYYAGRPVVATPFGTDIGVGGLRDAAAFFFARSEAEAESVLRTRRAGLLLLRNPIGEMASLSTLAPPGAAVPRVTRSLAHGYSVDMPRSALRSVAAVLYFGDGTWSVAGAAPSGLRRFRLLMETPPTLAARGLNEDGLKVFEVVRGARLAVAGARPASRVEAVATVVTNTGRAFRWRTSSPSDAGGRAMLTVPYASGWNGAVRCGSYFIADGASMRRMDVPEGHVRSGQAMTVGLR